MGKLAESEYTSDWSRLLTLNLACPTLRVAERCMVCRTSGRVTATAGETKEITSKGVITCKLPCTATCFGNSCCQRKPNLADLSVCAEC